MLTTALITSAMALLPMHDVTQTKTQSPSVIIPPICRSQNVIIPPRKERCDGIDNDCDGQIDEDFDQDSDGYFAGSGCEETYEQLDCNDADASVHPDATEMCDMVDNNCDEHIDENPICTPTTLPGDLLSVYHNSSELWWINSQTAQTTTANIQAPVTGETALAIDPTNEYTYSATGDSDDALYKTTLATGVTQRIGAFGSAGSNIQTLDFAPTTAPAIWGFTPGTLYGISIDGVQGCGPNCLVKINVTTGVATPLAAIAANQIRGMSFDPLTGQLWVLDPGGRAVYTLTGNGQLTYKFTLAPSNPDTHSGVNPTFSLSHNCTGDLFTVDQAYGVLVKINETSGTAQWQGQPFSIHDSTGSTALEGLDAICK